MSEPPINVYGAVVVSEEWFDWARASLAQADALAAAVEFYGRNRREILTSMRVPEGIHTAWDEVAEAARAYRAARGGA